MKNIKDIVDFLREKERSFAETKTYSNMPGVYAFFYIGKSFPVLGDKVNKHQIIYIGKTESTQEKRDLKTHFTSGKTGSSTVRKTIGSLLFQQENLIPIPRNCSDYTRGKFSHFKFDENSEEIITKWMKENLALSFYEYPKSKSEIDTLETDLIEYLMPILNITKNSENDFRHTLKKLRKTCASIAAKDFNNEKQSSKVNLKNHFKVKGNINTTGKYISLWQDQIQVIKVILKKLGEGSVQLDSTEFEKVGNRKNYSFNLEFNNCGVSNNIGGSAVARDLAKVLETDVEFKKLISSAPRKFSMGKDFLLNIKMNLF